VEMDAIWACPNYSEKTGSAGEDAAMLWSLSQSYSSFGWHLPALNQDVLLLIHCNVLNCFYIFSWYLWCWWCCDIHPECSKPAGPLTPTQLCWNLQLITVPRPW
jgi:hypothetical protein